MPKSSRQIETNEGGGPKKRGKPEPPPVQPPPQPDPVADTNLTKKWEQVNLQTYPEVRKYLGRAVKAVELPEKAGNDKTYPGLIVDAASGMGKTQQAFALLSDGKQELVYLLLVEKGADTRQDIYQEMTAISKMPGFLNLVDEARSAVANGTVQGDDPFGVNNLRGLLAMKDAALESLVNFIDDRVLKYDKNILTRAVMTAGKRDVDASICLARKVLFLDEVLPPSSSREPSEESLFRLPFLRNLGRALNMRVVTAGTAATAANMIAFRDNAADAVLEASRRGEADRSWMDIEMLWNRVNLPLFGPAMYTSHTERPYLRSLLDVIQQNAPQPQDSAQRQQEAILKQLAQKIKSDKGFSNQGKLIWLSGCWLASEKEIQPSPFPMGPADLVRSHFFEPALAITNKMQALVGEGNTRRTRKTGPLRIVLQRYKDDNHIWWVLAPKGMKAGLTSDFSRIEYALSNCVQVCLAMEPVLAVSLSISHRFSPEEYRKAFSELWKESPRQRTVGAMDGELNEYLMFSALQMACREGNGANFPNTRTVVGMVERLWQYLSATPPSPSPEVIQELGTILDCTAKEYTAFYGQETLVISYGNEGMKRENCLKKLHKTTMMPWLVPACSYATLKDKIQETQLGEKSLFSRMNIAGLVPGCINSSLDAFAHLWESNDKSLLAPLQWTFEFKCRTAHYSLTEAAKDLALKCANFKEQHKKDKLKFHSMLVALTASLTSECRMWLEGSKELRIVLLIGSGLLL